MFKKGAAKALSDSENELDNIHAMLKPYSDDYCTARMLCSFIAMQKVAVSLAEKGITKPYVHLYLGIQDLIPKFLELYDETQEKRRNV
jgi:hypothetical protein